MIVFKYIYFEYCKLSYKLKKLREFYSMYITWCKTFDEYIKPRYKELL